MQQEVNTTDLRQLLDKIKFFVAAIRIILSIKLLS